MPLTSKEVVLEVRRHWVLHKFRETSGWARLDPWSVTSLLFEIATHDYKSNYQRTRHEVASTSCFTAVESKRSVGSNWYQLLLKHLCGAGFKCEALVSGGRANSDRNGRAVMRDKSPPKQGGI